MVENPSNGELKKVSITGKDFQYDGTTRSSVNITESGASFIWSENDTVGIFPNTGSQAEFAMSQGAGTHTATFSGGGWALKSSATYVAYYPYNFYNRDLKNIPVSYEGQTQNGNASTAHIGAYDFMAASVSTPENGAVSFDMQHLGCLVQLTVDLDEAATINEVSIKYGEENSGEFITKGYIDLSSETPAIQASLLEDKSNTLSIALENFSVSAEETATVYFMMPPINLEGKTIDVTVAVDGGDTKTYQTAGKNYIAGKAYAISVTDNAEKPAYTMVDLGLPSGTLWADRNVGADSPEDYGDYFAWGETEPKETYNLITYKWYFYSDENKYFTKYCTDSFLGIVDNNTVLDLEDDAAYKNMGKEWRMPTDEELGELNRECTWEWIIKNGINGYKVTGSNGNSIFLPAAGLRRNSDLAVVGITGVYWSSSLYDSDTPCAHDLFFTSNEHNTTFYIRDEGRSVRAVAAVKKEAVPEVNKIDLGLPSGTLWADRNVGADSPEAYGDYFAWGETEPKEAYGWNTYKWCEGPNYTLTKYYDPDDPWGTHVLDIEDDAAYVNMGVEWRMPTVDELNELVNKCTWTWTTLNGVNGYKVTGPNSNSIFLPAAGCRDGNNLNYVGSGGYYWSSRCGDVGRIADFLRLHQFDWSMYSDIRYYGYTIRAVAR